MSRAMDKTFSALTIQDVLCLVHSNMDLGITAPLTKSIQEMSIVARSQILSKFLFHLISSQERCVIFIDDVQFLDQPSWKLIEKLTRRCPHLCMFLAGDSSKLQNAKSVDQFNKQMKKINKSKRANEIKVGERSGGGLRKTRI